MSDEVAEDMRVFGLSDEIAGVPREDDVEEKQAQYWIWPDTLKTLQVFQALRTQWDMVGTADGDMVRTGIRYEAFDVVRKHTTGLRPGEWDKVFQDIQRMERVALDVFWEDRARRLERRKEEADRRAAESRH